MLALFALGGLGFPELIILLLVFPLVSGLVYAVPACLISKKAGYSPWLGLLQIVPFGTIAWTWFLGLAEWPAGRPGNQRPPV